MNYNDDEQTKETSSCVNGIRLRSKMDQRVIIRRACARRRWSYIVFAILHTHQHNGNVFRMSERSQSLHSLVQLQWLVLWPSHSLSPFVCRVLVDAVRTLRMVRCGRIAVRVALSVSIWIWPEEDVEFYASRYSFSQVYKHHTFSFILSQCEQKCSRKNFVKLFAQRQYFPSTSLV